MADGRSRQAKSIGQAPSAICHVARERSECAETHGLTGQSGHERHATSFAERPTDVDDRTSLFSPSAIADRTRSFVGQHAVDDEFRHGNAPVRERLERVFRFGDRQRLGERDPVKPREVVPPQPRGDVPSLTRDVRCEIADSKEIGS